MPLIIQDRVYETTTTTGTGDLTLAGAIAGYRAFSSVCQAPDPNYSSVVLLCNFETGFSDLSSSLKILTNNGNAWPTNSSFKWGSLSGSFDGSGDFISTPDSADWDFGTGQFTVEAWVRFQTKTTNQAIIGQWDNAGAAANSAWYLYLNGSNLTFRLSNGTTTVDAAAAFTPTLGQWYHIAADRDGTGKVRLYVDGSMVASSTSMNFAPPNSTASLVIGAVGTTGGFPTLDFNGNLDDVRVTKGVSRYASDAGYTVPTAAFPTTGDVFYYMIEAVDGSNIPTGEWETGLGTYSAANTITRTTVHNSSNGGAAVSFSAGTKRVSLSITSTQSKLMGARVIKSADLTAQNLTTGAVIAFPAEEFDNGGFHDNSTNNSRITIPVGVNWVRLEGNLNLNNLVGSNSLFLSIRKNGVYFICRAQPTSSFNDNSTYITTGPIRVSPGEYFELFAQVTSDTSTDIIAHNSWFTIAVLE